MNNNVLKLKTNTKVSNMYNSILLELDGKLYYFLTDIKKFNLINLVPVEDDIMSKDPIAREYINFCKAQGFIYSLNIVDQILFFVLHEDNNPDKPSGYYELYKINKETKSLEMDNTDNLNKVVQEFRKF